MPTFQLLPGAKALDFAEGVSLKADRHGRVNVNDIVASRIRGSAAFRRYDAMVELAPGRYYPSPDSFSCECGFTPWPWQTSCPRCGQEWSTGG